MRKYFLIASTLSACFLTSCLKDENIEEMKYGMKGVENKAIVELPTARVTNTLDASNSDTTFALVRVHSNVPVAEDVQVTLVPNNTLVTDAGYAVAPANAYTLDNLTVTIPAGSQNGYLRITTKTANLADQTYGFGFSIGSVSNSNYGIASNFRNTLVVLPIRNKYEGTYTYTATYDAPADRPADWVRTEFTYEDDIRLATASANSVRLFNTAYSGASQAFLPLQTTGGASGFGGTALVITFDANDNVVSVNNPEPDSRNRQFQLIPNGNSRYDAGTGTLYLEMTMSQTGFAPIPMHIRMVR